MLAFFSLVSYFECNFVDIAVVVVVDVKREKINNWTRNLCTCFQNEKETEKYHRLPIALFFQLLCALFIFQTSTKRRRTVYTDENWKQIVELKKNKSNVNIYAKK